MAFVCRRRAFRCIFACWLLLAWGRPELPFPDPRSRIPFPRPLAKDAASIPNAPAGGAGICEEASSSGREWRGVPAGSHIQYPISHLPSPISHIPFPISHLSPSPGRLYILINKVFVFRQQSRSLSASAVIFGAGGVFPAFLSVRSISVFRRLSWFCDIFRRFLCLKSVKRRDFLGKRRKSCVFFWKNRLVTPCVATHKRKSGFFLKKVFKKCCMKEKSCTFALAKRRGTVLNEKREFLQVLWTNDPSKVWKVRVQEYEK